MDDKIVNSRQDPIEERFMQMEAQVTDINHIVSLLIKALTNKLGILGEKGCSITNIKSEGRLGSNNEGT